MGYLQIVSKSRNKKCGWAVHCHMDEVSEDTLHPDSQDTPPDFWNHDTHIPLAF